MRCDKNIVRRGDRINVSGLIDNSEGKADIKSYRVVLEEKIAMSNTSNYY